LKKILDRLIARQGQLMASLAESAAPSSATPAKAASSNRAARAEARLELQLQALDLAAESLSEGNLVGAAAALRPFEHDAIDVRILTTLARIESASGRFDAALALLERAYEVDPSDVKVAYFTAEVLELMGRHQEAIGYRRRVAFWSKTPDARSLVDLLRSVSKAATSTGKLSTSELQMAVDALLASEHVEQTLVLDACQILYGIPSQRNRAKALYERYSPCPAESVDVDVRWESVLQWGTSTAADLYSLPEDGQPGRRPRAACVANALIMEAFQFVPIVSGDTVAINGVANRNQRLQAQNPANPLLMISQDSCLLRLPKQRIKVVDPCVLVGGVGSYYHDLIEHIGSLASVEAFGLHKGRRLVLNASPQPFQRELLALLGYDASRLLPLPEGDAAMFSDLVVPTTLAHGGRWIDPLLVQWYRRRVARLRPGSRRVYLSRKRTQRRRVANEAAVEEQVRGLGFEVVVPEGLSVSEQVDLFGQAAIIVGASGAAMTNMLFAPAGARVVVFYNQVLPSARGALYFEALAAACGHSFAKLDCHPSTLRSGSRQVDADIMVDIDALAALVESSS
jgi:hypothetical protein